MEDDLRPPAKVGKVRLFENALRTVFYENFNVHYRTHNSPLPNPKPSQLIQVQILTAHRFKNNSRDILPSTGGIHYQVSSAGPLSPQFPQICQIHL